MLATGSMATALDKTVGEIGAAGTKPSQRLGDGLFFFQEEFSAA